jgi:hypothetical protein
LELKCTGRPLDATGKVQLAGFTDSDLGSSAKGTLHFDWRKGAITAHSSENAEPIPASLIRFDSWTADADIADNKATLADNTVKTGARTAAIKATVTFGVPPALTFGAPKPSAPKK